MSNPCSYTQSLSFCTMPKIPEHIRQKIQEAKEQHLKELDLSNDWGNKEEKKLIEIPAEVFELEQLEVLGLRDNRLTSIPNEKLIR